MSSMYASWMVRHVVGLLIVLFLFRACVTFIEPDGPQRFAVGSADFLLRHLVPARTPVRRSFVRLVETTPRAVLGAPVRLARFERVDGVWPAGGSASGPRYRLVSESEVDGGFRRSDAPNFPDGVFVVVVEDVQARALAWSLLPDPGSGPVLVVPLVELDGMAVVVVYRPRRSADGILLDVFAWGAVRG